ncbi:MAG: adaptor protein MecA [Clostridia bacterium]|nr:adaptor protein MecA [Clostridia bacterium]
MELLRIGDRKLKVTLSDEDMEKYRLDKDTLDYDTTETRSAFWQILDEAKRRTGFDAGGGRLFVQIYPSRGGGCEMYVTMTEEGTSRGRRPPSLVRGPESLYRFETLSLLLTVCRKLSELGYREESAVYTEGGAYYLVIREKLESSIMSPKALGEFSFIEEYGTRLSGGVRLAHLHEHGQCLDGERAVERFASL